ncbi:MAG: anaerobic ribonucleoside-triphosphate reductase activating protein [Sedimenticolaceae bacterium]
MTRLAVGGVTPLTTIDFPGELAAVVFCQGCPWRCRYCHNSHLLPRGLPSDIAWQGVAALLRRRRGLLDAVVFSGGEPTLQRGLPDAVREVREMGFKVGLHTAGCYPERLDELLPTLDWVGLDIKALPQDYAALTGVPGSGERAFESLQFVIESGVTHEVRVTVHDALLPEPRLRQLLALLDEAGTADVVLQRCRTEQVFDPSLGQNSSAWDHRPRCSVDTWQPSAPGADSG